MQCSFIIDRKDFTRGANGGLNVPPLQYLARAVVRISEEGKGGTEFENAGDDGFWCDGKGWRVPRVKNERSSRRNGQSRPPSKHKARIAEQPSENRNRLQVESNGSATYDPALDGNGGTE